MHWELQKSLSCPCTKSRGCVHKRSVQKSCGVQLHQYDYPLISHTTVSPISGCGAAAEEQHCTSNTWSSNYQHRAQTSARLSSNHTSFPETMSLHQHREQGKCSQSSPPKKTWVPNTGNRTCAPESDREILASLLLPRGQTKSCFTKPSLEQDAKSKKHSFVFSLSKSFAAGYCEIQTGATVKMKCHKHKGRCSQQKARATPCILIHYLYTHIL